MRRSLGVRQKPYPTQERERIDKHQRPALSSNYSARTLLLVSGRPMWGIPVDISRHPRTSYPQENQLNLGNPSLEDGSFREGS